MSNYKLNICCTHHLYFIEATKKEYRATCLYCNQQKYLKRSENLEQSFYGTTLIQHNQLKREHCFECNLQEMQKFVQKLILEQPNLTNNEVINELEIFFYTIDLSKLLLLKVTNKNFWVDAFYNKKIINIQKTIATLEARRHNYQKVKVKTK